MKLLDEFEMSEFAYNECRDDNNSPEMRKLINHPFWTYYYCLVIKDIPEMWRKIKDPDWARIYCKDIKDRPEVRKYAKKPSIKIIMNKIQKELE